MYFLFCPFLFSHSAPARALALRRLQAVARPDRESSSVVGPIMIGFLLFIVVGSALFEILRTATRGTFSD